MNSEPVNLAGALDRIEEIYDPRIVAQVNDYDVKIARTLGEHVWHTHEDTDEFFLVLDGEFHVSMRDEEEHETTVILRQGDTFVVPKGVSHKPSSPGGAIMMFEPRGTVNTGDSHEGEIPEHIPTTTGRTL